MGMNLAAWRYYIRFYRGSYRRIVVITALSMGQALFVLPLTLLIRSIFDQNVPASNFYLLVLNCVVILLIYLAQTGIDLWTRYQTLNITKRAILRLRAEMFDKFYSLPRAYFDQHEVSRLHDLMVQDTERVDVMSNALVFQLLPALSIGLALGLVLMVFNFSLFLVILTATPLSLLTNRLLRHKVRDQVNLFRQSFEAFSKETLFVLRRMDLIRMHSAEGVEAERQTRYIEHLRVTSGTMAWLQSLFTSLQGVALTVPNVLILIVGGQAIVAGRMTLGELLSFYVAAGLLNNYAKNAFAAAGAVQVGNESLSDVFDFLQTDAAQPYSGSETLAVQGEIRFADVSFQYRDTPIVRHIDLTIPAQSTVAVVGPNGVGKSTLVYLILGLYRPNAGAIFIDGHPLSDLDLAALRRQIAVVMQDPVLFSGTVLENITYGLPAAERSAVIAACEAALALDFIQRLPQGFDSPVGEDGSLLSGGQRQRIAIARALLRRPKILILDELTNHLDQAAITRLLDNLKRIEPPPTILLISHNSEVVNAAEQVYQMVDGRLISTSAALIQPSAKFK